MPDATDPARDLALAEARLIQAACAFVDAEYDDDAPRMSVSDLSLAVDAYRAALRAVPASDELVERGMAVVRRLLAEQEGT